MLRLVLLCDDTMSPSTLIRDTRDASEIKFLVPAEKGNAIREWARSALLPDPNATGADGDTYCTTSIYFDTADMDVFHRRGSFGRSKYRIRRYGSSSLVFLERKLKTKDLVSKRRSLVEVADLSLLAAKSLQKEWPGYWFHRRVLARDLSPVCQVSYSRTARVGMTDFGPIRLTLDQDVQAVRVQEAAFRRHGSGTLIAGDRLILELKFLGSMPSVFKQFVEDFGLVSSTISKYRFSAASLGLASSTRLPSRVCTQTVYA